MSDPASPAVTRPRPGGKSVVVLCFLSITVWGVAVVLLWPGHGRLLDWDEVDYVNAAKLGVWVNAFEKGSLSPRDFIRFAIAKISGSNAVLPFDYDESRDPFLLRHFHPPFVVFLLSAVSQSKSERVIRSVQLLGALAFICAIVFSYWSISASAGWPGVLLVSLLALWMIPQLFSSISFHGWMAVWTTIIAALLTRWFEEQKSRRLRFLLCASLTLALLTLETGFLVWIAAILCLTGWWVFSPSESRVIFPWREIAVGASITVFFVMVLWPGSIAKVSLLKIPAYYLYRIWLGKEYAGVPAHLPGIFMSLLPVLVMGVPVCLWLYHFHQADFRRSGPFIGVAGLYGIMMTPFAMTPGYLLPALAPLVCVVGVGSDRMSRTGGWILVAGLGLFLSVTTWSSWPTGAFESTRADLRWLEGVINGREALVDGGHIYQYYLGPEYVIQPITVDYGGAALLVREGGTYRDLTRGDITGKIVVIRASRHQFLRGRIVGTLLAGCPRTDRVSVQVFDCGELR